MRAIVVAGISHVLSKTEFLQLCPAEMGQQPPFVE
jgi:hypothetical protein